MNESVNDEAVYRTAPATPGLLKTLRHLRTNWPVTLLGRLAAMPKP